MTAGTCTVHGRYLTIGELMLGACSWCSPDTFKRNCTTCGKPYLGTSTYCPDHYRPNRAKRQSTDAKDKPKEKAQVSLRKWR